MNETLTTYALSSRGRGKHSDLAMEKINGFPKTQSFVTVIIIKNRFFSPCIYFHPDVIWTDQTGAESRLSARFLVFLRLVCCCRGGVGVWGCGDAVSESWGEPGLQISYALILLLQSHSSQLSLQQPVLLLLLQTSDFLLTLLHLQCKQIHSARSLCVWEIWCLPLPLFVRTKKARKYLLHEALSALCGAGEDAPVRQRLGVGNWLGTRLRTRSNSGFEQKVIFMYYLLFYLFWNTSKRISLTLLSASMKSDACFLLLSMLCACWGLRLPVPPLGPYPADEVKKSRLLLKNVAICTGRKKRTTNISVQHCLGTLHLGFVSMTTICSKRITAVVSKPLRYDRLA